MLVASGGAEALRIAKKHVGAIDLLVTDVVMLRMSGRELAQRLTQTRPDARLLYTSGYLEDAMVHRGVIDARVAFLKKLYQPSALLAKVRQTLDSPIRLC